MVALTGDASDRQYFRVHFQDRPSIVLALHAGPIDVQTLPFVSVARLMRAIPLPVPAILHGSNELGVLGLEDLGDVTLQAHLGVASRAEHAALYRQAVGFIATLQQRGAELASPDYPPYGIAFDAEKLTWELEFFIKHYLGAYRGLSLARLHREGLLAEWATMASELAGEPRVLCHRDYHSRNLMLHDESLYIIDFQDARMGPDTYDLVSLLRDSYVDLDAVAGGRAHRLLPRADSGAGAPERRRRLRVPETIRPDGAAAQPEGAGHVRLPDDDSRQPGVHPVHASHLELREGYSGPLPPLRPAARPASGSRPRVALIVGLDVRAR